MATAVTQEQLDALAALALSGVKRTAIRADGSVDVENQSTEDLVNLLAIGRAILDMAGGGADTGAGASTSGGSHRALTPSMGKGLR